MNFSARKKPTYVGSQIKHRNQSQRNQLRCCIMWRRLKTKTLNVWTLQPLDLLANHSEMRNVWAVYNDLHLESGAVAFRDSAPNKTKWSDPQLSRHPFEHCSTPCLLYRSGRCKPAYVFRPFRFDTMIATALAYTWYRHYPAHELWHHDTRTIIQSVW